MLQNGSQDLPIPQHPAKARGFPQDKIFNKNLTYLYCKKKYFFYNNIIIKREGFFMKINKQFTKTHNYQKKDKINKQSIQFAKSSLVFENEDKVVKSHTNVMGFSTLNVSKEKSLHSDENNRVTDKIYCSGGNKVEGRFHADFEVSPDKFVFEPAIKIDEETTASVGCSKEINMPGFHIRSKVEAGLQANADLGAAAKLKVAKDDIDIGFKIGDRLELGTYEGISLDARTANGTGVNMTVKLEQGPQLGGAIGAGIKIDKKGIHGNFELDGNFGIFGTDLKGTFDIQYADVNNLVNVVTSGPIGMAVSHVFHETSELIKKIKDKIHHKDTVSPEENKETQSVENRENTSSVETGEIQSVENKEVSANLQETQWQVFHH